VKAEIGRARDRTAYPATFALRRLRVRPAAGGAPGASVGVTVANTGRRTGIAVPQLYLDLPSAGSASSSIWTRAHSPTGTP
jgi:hypothetical protein